MAIADIVDIEGQREYWKTTPKPWVLGKHQSAFLLPHTFEFLDKNVQGLVRKLPTDILSLLDDIELYRQDGKPQAARFVRMGQIATMISMANMPWDVSQTYRAPYHSTLVDSTGDMIITGESLLVQTLFGGVTTLQVLLGVIDMYRRKPLPQSLCSCGHEQISHLFLPGTSACVERPCACRHYVLAQ